MTGSVHVGGAWHSWQPFAKVSGTWRSAIWWQRVGGIWKAVSGIRGTFVITDGHNHISDIGPIDDYGYGAGLGALVSNSLSQGTPAQFDTLVNAGSSTTTLNISGLAGDPGRGAFTTVSATNGRSLASSAATYSYAGGQAQWVWSAAFWGGTGANQTVTLS